MSGKLVNQAWPGFSESLQMFFTAFVLCSLRLLKLKTAGQTNYQEKASPLSYKTQIEFFAYLGLALNQSLNKPDRGLCFSKSIYCNFFAFFV